MKLTRATAYALRALVFLDRNGGRRVASYDVAAAEGIPEKFLLKCLRPLVVAGLVCSVQGPYGGYRLGRPAREITPLGGGGGSGGAPPRLAPEGGGGGGRSPWRRWWRGPRGPSAAWHRKSAAGRWTAGCRRCARGWPAGCGRVWAGSRSRTWPAGPGGGEPCVPSCCPTATCWCPD